MKKVPKGSGRKLPDLNWTLRYRYVKAWLSEIEYDITRHELLLKDYSDVWCHFELWMDYADTDNQSFNLQALRLRSGYYLVCVRRVDAVKTLGGEPYGHR